MFSIPPKGAWPCWWRNAGLVYILLLALVSVHQLFNNISVFLAADIQLSVVGGYFSCCWKHCGWELADKPKQEAKRGLKSLHSTWLLQWFICKKTIYPSLFICQIMFFMFNPVNITQGNIDQSCLFIHLKNNFCLFLQMNSSPIMTLIAHYRWARSHPITLLSQKKMLHLGL